MAGVEGVSEDCEEPPEAANSEPPLKERMYSTWYRLRYGKQHTPSFAMTPERLFRGGVNSPHVFADSTLCKVPSILAGRQYDLRSWVIGHIAK